MNATADYPLISAWPAELGPPPTEDHLIQAYALLADKPRARPKGTRKALAVAAYLSGHYWWPNDLGHAIDHAMGTPNGAGNDPRNVINERGEGLEDLGLVTLHRKEDDQRETWSCTLSLKGEATVAAYCAVHGIKNPPEFTPRASDRNPSWSRDELILALELYLRFNGNPPGKATPEIVELSALLNRIAGGGSKANDYRNPNGVYMKLMNFRRFDPIYQAQGKTGLTRGNKLEEVVWTEFAAAPDRITQTAKAIVAKSGRGIRC